MFQEELIKPGQRSSSNYSSIEEKNASRESPSVSSHEAKARKKKLAARVKLTRCYFYLRQGFSLKYINGLRKPIPNGLMVTIRERKPVVAKNSERLSRVIYVPVSAGYAFSEPSFKSFQSLGVPIRTPRATEFLHVLCHVAWQTNPRLFKAGSVKGYHPNPSSLRGKKSTKSRESSIRKKQST